MLGWLKGLFSTAKPEQPQGRSLRGRYDAAQSHDENTNLWAMTDYLSAKASNSYQVRKLLKIRSRYEVANNSYARGLVNTVSNDLIGTGPRLKVRTEDSGINRRVEEIFRDWAEEITLAEKLRLAVKAKLQDGEAFAQFVTNPELANAVKLDVYLIESDQVMTPDPGFLDVYWVDGMKLDRLGNPIEYHILECHPGDLFFPHLNPLKYFRVPAKFVMHWFRRDRPGQVRGIPEITPSLELFSKLRRFTTATIYAAETAANLNVVLETEAAAEDGAEVPPPFDTQEIERGLMTMLPYGTKANHFKSEHPATTYPMFKREILSEIARCLDIPYNIASGDSSGYNYSSARLDYLRYHKQIRVERRFCQQHILDRIFKAWLAEAKLISGLLPALPDTVPFRWHWDGYESIDPTKDASADQTMLQAGLITFEELYAERGEDWEEAFVQRGKEKALAKELGLNEQPAPAQQGQQQPAEEEEPVAASYMARQGREVSNNAD